MTVRSANAEWHWNVDSSSGTVTVGDGIFEDAYSGGSAAALRAAQQGVRVACIDQLCLLGRAQPACEWEWPLPVSVPHRRNRRRRAQMPTLRRRPVPARPISGLVL